MRWGREVSDALSSGAEITHDITEKKTKSVLHLEKRSEISQKISPSCSIADTFPFWPRRSNTIPGRCEGRQPPRSNEAHQSRTSVAMEPFRARTFSLTCSSIIATEETTPTSTHRVIEIRFVFYNVVRYATRPMGLFIGMSVRHSHIFVNG